MCVAAVGVVIAAAGLAINIFSQRQAGRANKNYYNYLATTAEDQIGDVVATGKRTRGYITRQAAVKSAAADKKSQQLLGTQRAAAAASGVGGGSVTTSQLAMDEVSKSILDDTYIRYQADVTKYEQTKEERAEVKSLRRQAKAYRLGGQAALQSADLSSAATLLSGASQVASMWYRK